MKLKEKAQIVRIYLGESDHYHGKPLYEVIVQEARTAGLAGATVTRAVMGFGATSKIIHSAKILRLSDDLPIVIEIVDHPEEIEAFLPRLDELLGGGLVVIDEVQVLTYREGDSQKA